MNFKLIRTSAISSLFFVSSCLLHTATQAAENGFYINANANVTIGPSTITVNKSAFGNINYASGNNTNTFGYANDGRFAYDGSIGFIRNNFGAEIKYISLGSQKQISQNGSSLGTNETGTYKGSYYGLSGKYFVPLNQGKQDLHVSIGGGRLSNTLSSSNSNATSPASSLTASQNEWALLLGAGIRFNLFKDFGLNLEVNRITPVTHGLFNSGIYNNAYTSISAGFVVSY
jgi:outer membrane protein W